MTRYIRRGNRNAASGDAERRGHHRLIRKNKTIAAGVAAVALTGLLGCSEPGAPSEAARIFERIKASWAMLHISGALAARVKRADFRNEEPAREVRHIADWVTDSGDSQGLPFLVIDKTNAKIFVFNSDGLILGAAPALLGSARGDESVPGIGERDLSEIRPEERTTPAGRFVAELGRNTNGEDIVWVDYDAAVSLHRVRANNPSEQRLQRLASPTASDNRISYGCINVPAHFYETVILPIFAKGRGIVYVLPETRAAQVVFGSYDVDTRGRRQGRPQTVAETSSPGHSPIIAFAARLLRVPF